jgi:hypothetical protein
MHIGFCTSRYADGQSLYGISRDLFKLHYGYELQNIKYLIPAIKKAFREKGITIRSTKEAKKLNEEYLERSKPGGKETVDLNKSTIKKLEELGLGKIRVSRGGVPHIVGTTNGKTYSIAFFHKSGMYRAFFPYPHSDQTKIDFKSPESVKTFIGILGT